MKYAAARLLWAALAAVLAVGPAAGCNHDDDDDDDAPTTPGGPPPPPPPAGPGVIELVPADPNGFAESGSVTLTVRRTGGATGRATVNWEPVRGSADSSDWTFTAPQTIVWNDGEQGDKPIVLPLVNDAAPEGDESFMVFIGSNRGAPIQGPDGTLVTIRDDDGGPGGAFQFSEARRGWDERDGTLQLVVTRSGGGLAPASVSVRLQDRGTNPADYTFASPQVLNFADGQASATLDIPITNDAQREGGESFALFLENPTPAGLAFVGTQGSMVVDIFDDDHPGVLSFTQSKWEVFEDGVSVTLTVQRTGGSLGSVDVQFAATDLTATSGSDYTLSPGTITWADRDVNDKTLVVTLVADAQAEGEETFQVTLSNPTGGAELGVPATAQVDIQD
jgi:hypothetical protein